MFSLCLEDRELYNIAMELDRPRTIPLEKHRDLRESDLLGQLPESERASLFRNSCRKKYPKHERARSACFSKGITVFLGKRKT